MLDLDDYILPGSPHHIFSTNVVCRVLFVFRMLITSGVLIVSEGVDCV